MNNVQWLTRTTSISAAMLLATIAGAANTPEVEPNDNKAGAQLVPLACNDTITGNTTGTSLTVAGPASADNFLVRTTGTGSLTLYTLTITSGAAVPAHTITIRGLTQTAGVPNAGTDAVLQTGVAAGNSKIIKWYGTGPSGSQQDIIVRVTGTAATTADYTLTLTCGPATITAMSGSLSPGNISVVPDTATSTALDTDWWVYDSTFTPVSTFAHDDLDTTAISRGLSTGTYYIALGNYNLANDQGSPSDDTFRSGALLDFPNVALQSTSTNYPTANMQASDGSVTVTGNSSRPNAFEIVWFSFDVAPPAVPQGSGLATPSTVAITGSTLLTVAVSPAINPPSTGLMVVADLSSINGSGTQQFYDDGSNGDVTAGDNVFSFNATVPDPQAAGARSLPFTVSDAENRSSMNNISLTLTAAPSGACCTAGSCSIVSAFNCGQGGGSYQGNNTNCGDVSYNIASGGAAFASISGTGTPAAVAGACDDCSELVNLPFSFALYQNVFSDVYVHSNGYLEFGASNAVFTNVAIPAAALPNNAIYPLWDDLAPNTAGDIYYQTMGTAPNRQFIVEWSNVTQFGATTSENFQAVLFEGSNNVEFRYGSITAETPAGDYTVGVENATGTVATSIAGASLGSGNTSLAVSYIPGISPCGPTCGTADFDGDGDVGTDADIEAFFACLGGNCCATCYPGGADFDADGDVGTDADIEAFFRVLAGGNC